MVRLFSFLLLTVGMIACGENSILGGKAKVAKGAFFDEFKELQLPQNYSDTIFLNKAKEANLLKPENYKGFVPDSIFVKEFGKKGAPKIFALGKFLKDEGNVLLIRAVKDDKQMLYALGFDESNKLTGVLPLISNQKNAGTSMWVEIDKNASLTLNKLKKEADGATSEVSRAYAYSAGSFVLAVSNGDWDEVLNKVIVNPIDTLPRTNRLSGDYVLSNTHLISFRDGDAPNKLMLFLYFKQPDGSTEDANGEIKGEAFIHSPDSAYYRKDGDPCVLGFRFKNYTASVTVHEQSSCGNHRCLSCEFKGTYLRGKLTPPKPKTKEELEQEKKDKEKAEKERKEKAEKEKKEKERKAKEKAAKEAEEKAETGVETNN
jgi:hypothetical protein